MAKIAVVSPHLDDAVLSCFNHMLKWSGKHEITVITVFTNTDTKNIPSYSQNILSMLGVTSLEYQKMRKTEDREVLKKYHLGYTHLNFVDAGFRQQNTTALYPTPNLLFSGTLHPADKTLLKQLQGPLETVLASFDYCISPLAIGNHSDHLVVRLLIENCVAPKKVVYYADVPYWYQLVQTLKKLLPFLLFGKKSFMHASESKKTAVSYYKTQVPVLFPEGLPALPELLVCKSKSCRLF